MEIKLPRLNKNDKPQDFPDQFNQTMEELERNLNVFNEKINATEIIIKKMNERLDDFYGKIIEIFGIFIAIFALILTTANNITVVKGNDVTETVLNTFYYLLPLTFILILFVLLLNWLRKR